MSGSAIRDVSDTAYWIAHHRAVETQRADALISDPLAARLAGERGRAIADAMPASRMIAWSVVIRTRVVDHYIRSALAQGADMVLNLGAGLDTRPYRMELPASLRWVEADYPRIIEHKESVLAGERPRCRLERVKIDLADLPQRRELFAALNAQARRILVLTEGVVPYLAVDEAAVLADDLHALDRVAWWVVDYFSPQVMKFRNRSGMTRVMANAPFRFEHPDPFAFFADHGWRVGDIRYLADEGERLGRPLPLPAPLKIWVALLTLLLSEKRMSAHRKFTGYMLLERQG